MNTPLVSGTVETHTSMRGLEAIHATTTYMTLEERAAECAELAHPGVTYNPQMDRTWCICGTQTYEGDQSQRKFELLYGGGPLDRYNPPTTGANTPRINHNPESS